jgi:anti-sigma-K factor RskA
MSETPIFGPDDHVGDIELLLRSLDTDDLEMVTPPVDIWAGIESTLDGERAAPVANLAHRRLASRTRWLSAAAAVAVIAAGAIVVSTVRNNDGGDVVQAAALEYDAENFDPLGAEASATAELIRVDGSYEIKISQASLPDPAENDLELWLISVDDEGTISDIEPVSLIDAASPGTYQVPDGIDPDVYSVVDISIEPRDGDEAHSGRSILRGTLADV